MCSVDRTNGTSDRCCISFGLRLIYDYLGEKTLSVRRSGRKNDIYKRKPPPPSTRWSPPISPPSCVMDLVWLHRRKHANARSHSNIKNNIHTAYRNLCKLFDFYCFRLITTSKPSPCHFHNKMRFNVFRAHCTRIFQQHTLCSKIIKTRQRKLSLYNRSSGSIMQFAFMTYKRTVKYLL